MCSGRKKKFPDAMGHRASQSGKGKCLENFRKWRDSTYGITLVGDCWHRGTYHETKRVKKGKDANQKKDENIHSGTED